MIVITTHARKYPVIWGAELSMAAEGKVPLQREVHALTQEAGDQVGQQVKEKFRLIEAYNMTLEARRQADVGSGPDQGPGSGPGAVL